MSIKQITQLPASTTLASTDVLAKETSGNTTQKITAEHLAAAVKVLASLVNTTEMNTAIAQSTAYSEGNIATSTYTADIDAAIAKVRKHGNHVWLDLKMSFTNGKKLPTSTAGATVPAGFRPTSPTYIPALFESNNSQNWIPYWILIDTDGTIKQNFSSTCTGIAILSSGYCI